MLHLHTLSIQLEATTCGIIGTCCCETLLQLSKPLEFLQPCQLSVHANAIVVIFMPNPTVCRVGVMQRLRPFNLLSTAINSVPVVTKTLVVTRVLCLVATGGD